MYVMVAVGPSQMFGGFLKCILNMSKYCELILLNIYQFTARQSKYQANGIYK